MDDRTALYRLFDDSGKLLYVGITKDPSVRFVHHKMEKPWWADVTRKDIEWFDSRTAALQAEEQAIHQELPFWNVSKSLTRKQAKRTSGRTRIRPIKREDVAPNSNLALLTFITARFQEEKARRDALRLEVAKAIQIASKQGMPQKDIAEVTGYTRQQVRRIVLLESSEP